MKKKVGVVIGASRDAIHTIRKAQEHNIYVVALDGNSQAEGLKIADQAIQVDISDQEKTLEVVYQINPDFILPIPIGRYLTTTGYVNEKLNLPGIGTKQTESSTDKYLFHKILHEKGLRPVDACLINKYSSKSEIKMSYPAIVKPRYGSGSRDVYYLDNSEELSAIWDKIQKSDEDFILEGAAVGEEYSVDGAVINGKFILTLLRKKTITPLPIRQPISSFSMPDNMQNQKLIYDVKEVIQAASEALEYNNCLLNADLIINEKGVFIIEMAPRPSGHNLHNVFVPVATGIDIAEEYIKYLLHDQWKFEPQNVRCLQIRFFDFEHVKITKVPHVDELKRNKECNLVMWQCNIQDGEYMQPVVNGHSIMGRGFFIVEGKDERDLVKQSDWVLSQFRIEAENDEYK